MPIIDFPKLSYDDIEVNPRCLVDKLTDVINQLDWLLRRLDGKNIQQEAITIKTEEGDAIVDNYGINDEYLDYYPNKCFNSSFETFNTTTKKPDYWDTNGEVSPDANFADTHSLKLTSGQYAEQAEDALGRGLSDPAWWGWCDGRTRIAFQVKSPASQVRVSVWQGGATVPIAYWTKNAEGEDVEVITEPPHYVTFDVNTDWINSRVTYAALPSTSGGKIKLRFDNVGGDDIYIDAVLIRADWTGKWPGLYKPGQMSNVYVNARVGGRNLWVQTAAPTAEEVGDLWVDTT